MTQEDIVPIGGPEPTVQFRLESDRDLFEILNEEANESLIKITGYDVQIWFNTKHLKSVEQIESACNAVGRLFRDLIMQQILGTKLEG